MGRAIEDINGDLASLRDTAGDSLDTLVDAQADAVQGFENLGQSAGRMRDSIQVAGQTDTFSELTEAADRAQREIEETGSVTEDTMQVLRNAVDGSSSHFNSLSIEARSSLSDVENAINWINDDLARLEQASQNSLNGLSGASQNAQQDLNNVGDEVNELDNELQNLGDDNGLQDVNDDAEELGDTLGSLGGAGGVIAGVGGAFLVAASGLLGFVAAGAGVIGFVKSSDELKRAVNGLEASTGATNEEMDEMRQSLIDIYGNNYGDGYEDIATSIGEVKKALNLTGDELELATTKALLLRDSLGWEVPETMIAVRSMMVNFGYDAETAMNLLVQGEQDGINVAGDLLDVFNEFSGAFNDLGFNGEDAMNMIRSAMDAGAKDASIAADSVNEFATLIRDGSDATKEALQDAGLDANSILKEFDKGGPAAAAAFQKVTEAVGGIGSQAKQEQVAVSLFGSMAEDAGVKAVLALGDATGQVDATKDTLTAMDSVKYDTLGEAITGVGRKAVAHVLIPLQDKVMPGVNGAINGTISNIGSLVEAFGSFIRGDESSEDILSSYGLDPDNFKGVLDAMNLIPHALSRIRSGFTTVGDVAKALFALFRNQDGTAIELLAGLGLDPPQIQAVMNAVDNVKNAFTGFLSFVGDNIDRMKNLWSSGGSDIFGTIKRVFIDSWPTVKETLAAVVGFIGGQIAKILEFWNENGSQIMAAVSNIFNGIMAVVEFVMPLVLGIIKMVWTNIKGVISGALDVIMGLVKVFSGLFTGDFSKMWEGLKQVFMGAVTFLWNFVQLTFFGKILGGLKVFILSFRTFFDDLWKGIISLFKGQTNSAMTTIQVAWQTILRETKSVFNNIYSFFKDIFLFIKNVITGAVNGYLRIIRITWSTIYNTTRSTFTNVWNFFKSIFTTIRNFISSSVTGIYTRVRDTWSMLRTNTSNAFRDIFNGIKSRFTNIVDAAKALPGRIGDGIGSMASKVTSGVTKVINKLASTLGKGVNGVIGGINWVLDKIGVDTDIPKWTVPEYAQGTKHRRGAHPGGPMIVGDGTGSNKGPELIETPDGKQMLSPSKPTLMNGEEGTKVWSATETKKIMAMVPHYALGDLKDGLRSAGDWVADKYNAGKKKVKAVGSKIKDVAVNAFDYIKSPGKFLDLALKTLGIEKPKGGTFIGDMAAGGWNKAKEEAINYVKSKLTTFGASQSGIALTGGNGGGFGAPFRFTSGPGPRNTGIPGASTYHKGWDWAAPIGTPIPSVTDGVGHRVGYHPLSGNFVEVRDASGKVHRYQHNSKNIMRVGQQVKKGQTVALVGDTGVGSGAHLHYQVNGYEDGGIVDGRMGAQLAWLTEGGWSESVISHDPAKKTSQKAIWEQTGKELGFNTSDPRVLEFLERIATSNERLLTEGIPHGHDISVNGRRFASLLEPFITDKQELNKAVKNEFKR
ncbi:murein DD-endopeptidase MepM/ murein hydrolase activator NlpD [Planomicrobium stackebrandtii]|uniref:Murein DD-endopeptidase MepM/ murein hydrolase activator NlpD n=1 Tax=Planomicrobium stackebrandtii TaxID=253160 RepID=A0ABU0GSY1_9BACL|nr:peptidoglycan DD-metalloendopeptidase family protein [Planomicrobium stackebrandtii]MDQ0427672.1 murein DD-endopeptidase MepM/ murein hydrolase activator NlpD [Planomicrobium stackebrandtii]